MAYRTLKSESVIETIGRLEKRMGARFPDAGLRRVCATLLETADRCAAEADRLNRPALPIRISVYAVWVSGAAALAWVLAALRYDALERRAISSKRPPL